MMMSFFFFFSPLLPLSCPSLSVHQMASDKTTIHEIDLMCMYLECGRSLHFTHAENYIFCQNFIQNSALKNEVLL